MEGSLGVLGPETKPPPVKHIIALPSPEGMVGVRFRDSLTATPNVSSLRTAHANTLCVSVLYFLEIDACVRRVRSFRHTCSIAIFRLVARMLSPLQSDGFNSLHLQPDLRHP